MCGSQSPCLGKAESETAEVVWSSPLFYTEESSSGGHSGSVGASVCASSIVPAPVSAFPAEGLGNEWRGHPSGIEGQQLSLRSGRSCRVWMWPPAWPGNLGIFLFPWYLKELFVLCPHLPTSAHTCPRVHTELFDPTLVSISPVYNGSCRCALDVHNCGFFFFCIYVYFDSIEKYSKMAKLFILASFLRIRKSLNKLNF